MVLSLLTRHIQNVDTVNLNCSYTCDTCDNDDTAQSSPVKSQLRFKITYTKRIDLVRHFERYKPRTQPDEEIKLMTDLNEGKNPFETENYKNLMQREGKDEALTRLETCIA